MSCSPSVGGNEEITGNSWEQPRKTDSSDRWRTLEVTQTSQGERGKAIHRALVVKTFTREKNVDNLFRIK